jgi:glyoxylase-like metal-dependent hydrolase (beta-lactamase superfamily II)
MVVLFVEDRVIHLGDLFFNGRYPNIDLEGGGSVKEWIATLDRVLAIDGYDQVIPGHGPVSDRDGIRAFQAFLRELWEQASAAAAAGKSLEETLASVRLTTDAGFEPIRVPLVLNLDQPFVIRRAWEEATGTVRPQGPAAQDAGATP